MPKPPDLDANGQPISGKPPDLDAHGQPIQDAGLWEGIKHTLPTPSNLMATLRAIPGNINHSLSPTALDDTIANFPNTPGGKLLHGRPMEGLGELIGGIGQMAAGEAAGGYIRGKLVATPPEMLKGVSVEDLKAAGVGDQALDVMRNGRPKPITGTLRLAPKSAKPEPAPPTVGNLALKPEYQPMDAPTIQPPPTRPTSGTVTPTRQMELLQKFGGTADPGQPLGQPRVMTLKETPTSWTPEAARARLEYNDWHSGAEPGSAEAKSAQALHRYEAETQSRYKYLLDSPNGSVNNELLKFMGLPVAKYTAAAMGAHQVGLPGWAGMAGMGAYDVARANPAASVQALRAALLARLSAQQSANQSDTPHQR